MRTPADALRDPRPGDVSDTAPQPPPVPTESEPIYKQVIADIEAKAEVGHAKYGTYLQADNGRDHLADAYQESIDKTKYLKCAIRERRALLDRIAALESQLFALQQANGETVAGNWRRRLRWLFREAGVDGGHAHRFRDTFAVQLLDSGSSTEDVAAILGHSDPRITARHYSPWVKSRQKRLDDAVVKSWHRTSIVQEPDFAMQVIESNMVSRAGLAIGSNSQSTEVIDPNSATNGGNGSKS